MLPTYLSPRICPQAADLPTYPQALEPVLGLTHGGYIDRSRGRTFGGYIDGYKSRVDENGGAFVQNFLRPADIVSFQARERSEQEYFQVLISYESTKRRLHVTSEM